VGENAIRPAAIGDNLDLVGDFVQPAFELVDRDVDGARQVARRVFELGPDIEERDVALGEPPG
jgi:hypothetical protein